MGSLTVTFEDYEIEAPAESGETILEVANHAGVRLASYCGGRGVCNQCGVVITSGKVQSKDAARWYEQPTEDGQGLRVLACQSVITEDISVHVPLRSRAEFFTIRDIAPLAGELVDLDRFPPLSPLTRQFVLELPQPSREDATTDLDRVLRGLLADDADLAPVTVDLPLLRELPTALRDNDFHVAVAVTDAGPTRTISTVRATGAAQSSLGVAIDVGTSTVVVQLVDLTTGQVRGAAMRRNAQIAYGEDVISRIVHTQQHDRGLREMYEAIRDTINDILGWLYDRHAVSPEQVIAVGLAGNATMMNLLLQIEATPIRHTPHTPPASLLPVFEAGQLGLNVHRRAGVFGHAAVNGFVGGDITAGILAVGMHKSTELCLLIDVGTNGEIVIGNKDWLMCASCSAGPAFEGVGVDAAMPATAGAITRLRYDPGEDSFEYETIDDQPPRGICGTGLVEMLATLVEAGAIDRSGQIDTSPGSERVREYGYEAEFVLLWAAESATGEDITIRQHDIDNLLRSKAAVLAGITVMLENLGLTAADAETLYLAGAFGAGLDVDSAVAIGLLPDVARERIQVVGNSALAGAYLALMSGRARQEANDIAASLTYLDLSTDARFMDEFIASDFIPHTDLSRFPSIQT